MTANADTHNFQAEVSRLLHMMVHSVYSEREVFLRELISNAADACDKLRYLAITKPELLGDDSALKITLIPDKKARTLTLADNGIGMTKDELVENLGTIARSGTKAFMEKYGTDNKNKTKDKTAEEEDTKDAAATKDEKNENSGSNLIGQFGVGFYAAFMVADKVDVISRYAGSDEAWKWSSDGLSGFTIEPATENDNPPARGTKIIMHLKDDAEKFLETYELSRIVSTYSDHISFPIELITPVEAQKEEDADEKDAEKTEDGKAVDVMQLNSAGALWARPKSDITPEQYNEFYHHVAHLFDEPAHIIHYNAEGRQNYTVLLFIPSSKPFDLFEPSRPGHIKLYVRKVFITDNAELLPSWLRFMRGVIDSEDVPLNLSREMLQNNPVVEAIRQAVTKRILKELTTLATKKRASYEKIWENFGPVLKEGLYEDAVRRDDLYEITLFHSTAGEGWRTLADYVEDMPEQQKEIYYLTGENLEQMRNSPQLEGYKARGLEVLLLSDPVDSFWVSTAMGYKGKPFKSITQGDVNLADIPVKDSDKQDEDAEKEDSGKTAELVTKLKEILSDHVEDVRLSQRLVDSPVCLVAPEGAPDRVMEKLLQYRQEGMPATKPVLEVNGNHKLFQAAAQKMDSEPEVLKDFAWLLLDEARILEGGHPEDPALFAQRLNRMLQASL